MALANRALVVCCSRVQNACNVTGKQACQPGSQPPSLASLSAKDTPVLGFTKPLGTASQKYQKTNVPSSPRAAEKQISSHNTKLVLIKWEMENIHKSIHVWASHLSALGSGDRSPDGELWCGGAVLGEAGRAKVQEGSFHVAQRAGGELSHGLVQSSGFGGGNQVVAST